MQLDVQTINLLQEIAGNTVRRTLEELGLVKNTFSQADIIKLYGIGVYKMSLQYVKWQKKGPAKTSPVICLKSDFERFVMRFDIEQKPLK